MSSKRKRLTTTVCEVLRVGSARGPLLRAADRAARPEAGLGLAHVPVAPPTRQSLASAGDETAVLTLTPGSGLSPESLRENKLFPL